MTDYREQAIRDVAAAVQVVHRDAVGWVRNRVDNTVTVEERSVSYAIAQRERVLELEARERWISVKERSPDPNCYVQVTNSESPRYLPGTARVLLDEDGQIEFWFASARLTVTHWKPLPAPPVEAQLPQKEAQR